MSIYLDYNASSPIDTRVLDTMMDIYKNHMAKIQICNEKSGKIFTANT